MGRTRIAVIVAAVITAAASIFAVAAAVTSDDSGSAGPATVASTPGGSPPPAATDSVPVEIKDFAFGSGELTVSPGTEVVWTNADSVTHTVVADDGSFASGDLPTGASFAFTFTTPGTYTYICGIHDSMKGTITVAG